MKIAIIGAGAIGGLVGARLALAGEDVTFIVRGRNLDAIRERGIKLITTDGMEHTALHVKATDDYAEAGPQDVVIPAMKAHQLEAVVDALPHLLGPDTTIVPMQNGIPYWYFQKHGGPHEGTRVASVDPQGRIAAGIEADRVLGCIVYPASVLVAPGVVRHIEGDRFPLGELDGRADTERVRRIAACFTEAGFKAFNELYVGTLRTWGLFDGQTNPVARSNVCPELHKPREPSFYAFAFTVAAADSAPTFCVAGSGECPEGKGNYRDHIVRRGDLSADGLAEKARWVLGEMERRQAALGASWSSTSAVQVYTVHDFHSLMAREIVTRGAAHAGVTWHYCRPPVVDIDYEMDCRGVAIEHTVD